MKSCRTASAVALVALSLASVAAACRDAARPEIPPLTTATPGASPILGPETAKASPTSGPATSAADLLDAGAGPVSSGAAKDPPKEPPATASFVDVPGAVPGVVCTRVFVSVARGKASLLGEALTEGDTLVVTHPDAMKVEGAGLALVVSQPIAPCPIRARPATEKKVVRAKDAPELRWAGGTMSAHLDVGTKLSPELYLGRLAGTAGVAEHTHPTSWEILAAVEASGTFVLDGTERKLGPRQIVMVPPGAKHAWKPDPGSKLVAIQMYSPPGPEQRFVALAAGAAPPALPALPDAGKK